MSWDYQQPDFYRFSEDSIWLAKFASSRLNKSRLSVLDLFSGCGVVGLELISSYQTAREICFIEIQKEFIPYLHANIKKKLNVKIDYDIFNGDFRKFNKLDMNFDLIVANPPYFKKGRLSHNANKNRCRHQLDFSWEEIFSFVDSYLADCGQFIFLARESLVELKKFTSKSLELVGTKGPTHLFVCD